LGCRYGLVVLGVITLDSVNEIYGHVSRKEGAFPIGFHATAPARIAKDVDVRRPEGNALVNPPLVFFDVVVVFGAPLIRDGDCHAAHKASVPTGGKTYGLRIHSSQAA